MNIQKFEIDNQSFKIKELLSEEFLEVDFKAISTANPNRNGSHFTEESLNKAIPTCYNKPILGSFSKDLDDFRAHESEPMYDNENDNVFFDNAYAEGEVPIGLIRSTDSVRIEKGADGLTWMHFTGAIWTQYSYRQVKNLLKKNNKKVSVEVTVNDFEMTDEGIEIIKDFTLNGITILGDHVTTGIPDAEMTIPEIMNRPVFQKRTQALRFALDNLQKSCLNNISSEDTSSSEELEIFRRKEDDSLMAKEKFEDIAMEAEEMAAEEPVKEEEAAVETCEAEEMAAEEPAKEEEACGTKCEAEEMAAEDPEEGEEPVKEEEAAVETCEAEEMAAEEPAKEEEACGTKCAAEEPAKEEEAAVDFCGDAVMATEEPAKEEEACGTKCAAEEPVKEEEAAVETCEAEEMAAEEPAKEEEACGTKCAAEEPAKEEEAAKFAELQEKYEALQNDYNDLKAKVQAYQAKELTAYAVDFFAGEDIDDEAKAKFSKEVEEKCNAFEFNSKEEVMEFAENKVAMHLYKLSKEQKNMQKEFEGEIQKNDFEVEVPKKENSLLEAIKKLNYVNV